MLSNPPKIAELITNFESFATTGIASILMDPGSLRALSDQFADRSAAYNEAARLFSLIPPPSQLSILVDFDVLLAYVKDESAGNADAFEIRYFFEHSSLPYKLPTGTREELEKYLRKDRFFDRQLEPVLAPRSHSLDSPEVSTQDFTTEEMHETQLRYERLSRVLGSDRFHGVEDEFDYDVYRTFLEYINSFYTSSSTFRSENNERDAKNLALAVRPWRDRQDRSAETCYLLLSATSSVHSAAKDLSQLAKGHRITITPTQAAMIELLGYTKNHEIAISHARAYKLNFNRLAEQLAAQLQALHQGGAHRPRASLSEIEKSFRNTLRRAALRDVARIEQQRYAFKTIANCRRGVYSDDVLHNSFVKTIDALRKLLDDINLLEYSFTHIPLAKNQHRFHVFEKDSITDEPMCVLEWTSLAGEEAFWKAQWRLDVSEQSLIALLEECPLIFPDVDKHDDNEVKYDIIPVDSSIAGRLSMDGIVVVMPTIMIHFDSSAVVRQKKKSFLRLGALRRLALSSVHEEKDVERRAEMFQMMENAFFVDSIFINTAGLQIAFECDSQDGRCFRKCDVLFRQSRADVIAPIYARLGPRVILRAAFAKMISKIMNRLEESAVQGQ